jgi:hypothetical protein
MVALIASHRLSLSPGLIAAAIVGGSAALAAALLPEWRFTALVVDSGLPALLPAAAPPLGNTARLALMLLVGGLAGGATYAAALRFAPVERRVRTTARRADAHPDAPLREPVKAMRELGTPFLDAVAVQPPPPERDLPSDLETPLAAFDPTAIPDTPRTPSAPVAPLFRAPDPVATDPGPMVEEARIEVFEFTPPLRMVIPAAVEREGAAFAAPATDATVHDLLDRLEHGVRRAAGRRVRPTGDLDAALATLKRYAAGGAR